MFLLIDNYDSFTYNLFHYLGELGADVVVHRNDALGVDDVIDGEWQGIILSPGPCTPNEAGICLELVERLAGKIPLLGVCLGHQVIGQVFGGTVARAPRVMHGKTSPITHDGQSVFANLPSPFVATRYHSLIVEEEGFPDTLSITARSDDGLIMGLAHTSLPLHGVQFHPESIATTHGHDLLANFLKICGVTPQHVQKKEVVAL
ncbi:MAG: aminodeoxychorismate/anthranilate synthase component II [Pseudomonadota bacterium]